MTPRPLEYQNSVIYIAALRIYVDSISVNVRDVSCRQ